MFLCEKTEFVIDSLNWNVTVLKTEEIFQVISTNVHAREHSLVTWKNLRCFETVTPQGFETVTPSYRRYRR